MTKYVCTKCGNTSFTLVVSQLVDVEFSDDEPEVIDGPRGDMEWTDESDAICTDCGHCDTLATMKVNTEEAA